MVLEIVGHIVMEILQGVFEVVCHFTAKVLLPVLSFGYVRVEPLPQ